LIGHLFELLTRLLLLLLQLLLLLLLLLLLTLVNLFLRPLTSALVFPVRFHLLAS
jgi:hypothetical protein